MNLFISIFDSLVLRRMFTATATVFSTPVSTMIYLVAPKELLTALQRLKIPKKWTVYDVI